MNLHSSHSHRLILFPLLCVALLLGSCANKEVPEKVIVKKVQDVNKTVSEELLQFLSKKLSDSVLVVKEDTLLTCNYISSLSKDYKLLFTDKGKYTALGDTLFNIIKDARYYGLIPDDYHYRKLDTLKKQFQNQEQEYDAVAIARTELLFSDAYFKLGAHLNKGRFYPDSLLLEWNPRKLDTNWLSVLKWGLDSRQIRKALDSLEPKHEGFVLLKKEFRKFMDENKEIAWDSVSCYNVGDTNAFKQQLKNRLMITGDYDSTVSGNDSVKLSKGIKSFQKKFNLDPDGKLGKYTRQALTYSKEKTIRQMEMALERWRWEPRVFPKVYFWVNIPAANLHIYEKDKKGKDTLVLFSNIVVGKPENQTPVLRSKINYMLIYPYWNVPYSIAWKEILPMVQRDTSYLRKKNFEVIGAGGVVLDPKTINWKKYNKTNLPFKFRQRIGEENSLGVVKFNFNNKYGVYLHDTNSKRYFKTFYRFQSHGCMRLDKYWETAKFLIRDDTLKLPYDTLALYFATPEQRQIPMKKSFPIFVRYYTELADSTGLHHYIDIYRKDEKLMKLVYKEK
ncbi:MAG: murein L,D-transpeptidase [Bacteroidia bacterium]